MSASEDSVEAIDAQTSLIMKSKLELAAKHYHDWKQILSGALNDKQLLCGILIILYFYLLYSIFNIAINVNDKDEDSITCQCPAFYKRFYKAIVIAFCLVWIVCFVSITIFDLHRLYKSRRGKNVRVADSCSNKNDDRLDLCEDYLWLEFYKAYSVGSGVYKSIDLPDIRNFVKVDLSRPDYIKTISLVEDLSRELSQVEDTDGDEVDGPLINIDIERLKELVEKLGKKVTEAKARAKETIQTRGEEIAKHSYYFFYPILIIVRLLAQVTLVPILLVQMLDNYTWICITEDYHCQNAVTYSQLGLYQVYLTFCFYMALLIAILSSTMIRWFPYSQVARQAGASCFE